MRSETVAMLLLAVFATAFAPFIDDEQRNYLVIGLSALMPLLMLILKIPPTLDLLWSAAVILYMLVLLLLTGTTQQISTIAYTALFLCSYLFISGCLTINALKRRHVTLLLRWIILSFGAVSAIQFLTSYFEFWVPNEILSTGLLRHNSLAVEPSHLARVLCISIFVYFTLRKLDPMRDTSTLAFLFRERLVIAAFLVSIFLSGSALGAIAAPIALLPALSIHWTLILAGVSVLSAPLFQASEIEAIQRGLRFVAALPTLDIFVLADADHSGSVRLMPFLVYLSNYSAGSFAFWFGSGPYSEARILAAGLPGVAVQIYDGFVPGFLIAYGLVGFLLMSIAFIFRFLRLGTLFLALFWFALFFSSPWNSQLFWFGLMLLRIVYHFEVRKNNSLDDGERHKSRNSPLVRFS